MLHFSVDVPLVIREIGVKQVSFVTRLYLVFYYLFWWIWYEQNIFYDNFSDVNECSLNACKNNGTCQNTNGSFTCNCTGGFRGPTCNEGMQCIFSYLFAAIKNLIYFHNSCDNVIPYFLHIIADVNECLSSPCGNNGLCVNTYGGFVCPCQYGYHGDICETGKILKSWHIFIFRF